MAMCQAISKQAEQAISVPFLSHSWPVVRLTHQARLHPARKAPV